MPHQSLMGGALIATWLLWVLIIELARHSLLCMVRKTRTQKFFVSENIMIFMFSCAYNSTSICYFWCPCTRETLRQLHFFAPGLEGVWFANVSGMPVMEPLSHVCYIKAHLRKFTWNRITCLYGADYGSSCRHAQLVVLCVKIFF